MSEQKITNKHALILTSALFFWFAISQGLEAIFSYKVIWLFPILLLTMSFISLGGALLFLKSEKVEPIYRSAVLPLCLCILVVCVSGLGTSISYFLYYLSVGGDTLSRLPLSDVSGFILMIGLLFLAPCSLWVFKTVRTEERTRRISYYLALIITLIAVVAVCLFPFYIATYGSIFWFTPIIHTLFMVLGLPLLGFCYIACGIVAKNKEGKNFEGIPQSR